MPGKSSKTTNAAKQVCENTRTQMQCAASGAMVGSVVPGLGTAAGAFVGLCVGGAVAITDTVQRHEEGYF